MLQIQIAKELSTDTTLFSQKQIDILASLLFKERMDKDVVSFQNLAIVRNPLSRLYSVYRSIFRGSSKDFIYENYLFGLFNKDMSFNHFIDNLVKIPPIITDYHFKPQHELIYHHQHVTEVKIFKMEEINMTLNPYLESHFGINLAHLNMGHGDTKNFREIYSLETARKMYKYYYQDFNFFDYTEDFNNLITKLSGDLIR